MYKKQFFLFFLLKRKENGGNTNPSKIKTRIILLSKTKLIARTFNILSITLARNKNKRDKRNTKKSFVIDHYLVRWGTKAQLQKEEFLPHCSIQC